MAKRITIMHLTPRPDLHDATDAYAADVLGVWVQPDTWDTHALVLFASGDSYTVCMWNVRQPAKGELALDADLEDALSDFEDDSATFTDLGEAVASVSGGYGEPGFAPGQVGDMLRDAYAAHKEAKRVAGLSAYARKQETCRSPTTHR
jgi:hypothetical protein